MKVLSLGGAGEIFRELEKRQIFIHINVTNEDNH